MMLTMSASLATSASARRDLGALHAMRFDTDADITGLPYQAALPLTGGIVPDVGDHGKRFVRILF